MLLKVLLIDDINIDFIAVLGNTNGFVAKFYLDGIIGFINDYLGND